MKKRKLSKRGSSKTFHPDEMVTSISQALSRDLARREQMYPPSSPLVFRSIEMQLQDFKKKYLSSSVTKDSLDDATYKKFLFVNEHMGKLELNLPDPSCFHRKLPFRDKVLLRAKAYCRAILFDFDEEELFHCCKHSSGASIGVPFFDTSVEAKFSFPISVTREALVLFQRYLDFDFQLKSALVEREKGLATPMYNVVSESRAVTVEKTNMINRMIAVEPTANMFLQQGLMELLTQRLRRVGLDFRSLPSQHKLRAWESSITGRESTIDFSSASDCVSTELLKWLLPLKWFYVLDRVRCKQMLVLDRSVKLNMFSTMGNAGTFPLETLVFWTLSQAVHDTLSTNSNSPIPNWSGLKNSSVFGDDCIVRAEDTHHFIDVCTSVGFIVNEEKTYYGSDRFRESCGGDYYAGFDVRPYYIRGPVSNKVSSLEPWLYIIMNSLKTKYILYFGATSWLYEKQVFEVFAELFKKYNLTLKVVPDDFPDDSGFKISDDFGRFNLCYRFNNSKIEVDKHGTHTFKYLRFDYRSTRQRDDYIRYCLWLKRPIFLHNQPSLFQKVKRRGGYITAKTSSCFFQLRKAGC